MRAHTVLTPLLFLVDFLRLQSLYARVSVLTTMCFGIFFCGHSMCALTILPPLFLVFPFFSQRRSLYVRAHFTHSVVVVSDADDNFTPTKHLTPPPHHSSRPAAAHTDPDTTIIKRGVGPVDGPPNRFLGCSVAYSIYSIGGCYTCHIVYYTIVLHSVLDANFGIWTHSF